MRLEELGDLLRLLRGHAVILQHIGAHLDGQAEESVECAERALSLFPDYAGCGIYGAIILAYNHQGTRSVELARGLAERLPFFDIAPTVHAYALAQDGRASEARLIVERQQWLSRERFVLNSFLPAVYVALGDLNSALAELHISAEAHCPWFFQMLADPRLKPLRRHPGFQELQSVLSKMEADVAHETQNEDELSICARRG